MSHLGQSHKVRVNAMLLCKMIKLLQLVPISYDDLAEKTGLHIRTVCKWVIEMRRQELVHIGGWRRHSTGAGSSKPLWAWGFAVDVPRPKLPRHVILQRQAEAMAVRREQKRKEKSHARKA
jgi:hypothetical protein